MSIRDTVVSAAGRLSATFSPRNSPECVVCQQRVGSEEQTVERDGQTAHRDCAAALQRGTRFLRTRGDS